MVLMLDYTTIHHYEIDLEGRRPRHSPVDCDEPPHTRGEPLVNPPEGPCGAGESATSKCDNFDGYLSRDRGCSDLYFSQVTELNVCAAKP